MHAHIEFLANERRKGFVVTQPNYVRVESSWKMLTDLAEIHLARNMRVYDRQFIKEVFRPGDKVKIQLGANGDLAHYFTGYIKRVSADIPIKIELEDEMYQLKFKQVKASIKNASLKQLLTEISPIQIDAADYQLGDVRVKTTLAKVLQKLKEDFGIYSYIKDGVLVSGKVYDDDNNAQTHQVHLERQSVGDSLKYKSSDEVRIKVEAVSTLLNGKKITVTAGDEDGELRKLSFFNVEDEKALKLQADKAYQQYKVDGYSGVLELFAFKAYRHGEKIEMFSDLYQDRSSINFIDKVVTEFKDDATFHHRITPGRKVA